MDTNLTTETAAFPPAADEPVMVNVTHMTRDKYFEAVKARTRYGRSLLYMLGGAAAAVVGLLMSSKTVALLGLLAAVLAVASPAVIGWRDYRKLCELHPGGEWDKTVRFYRDRVETDSGTGRVSSAPYRSIKREAETEHMYILEFGRSLPATTFDKDGFTLGSAEELRSFLTEVRRGAYDAAGAEDDDVDEQGPSL